MGRAERLARLLGETLGVGVPTPGQVFGPVMSGGTHRSGRSFFSRLRTEMTESLEVAPASAEARRGQCIDVDVTVSGSDFDAVDVGLVCTEYYDVETKQIDDEGNKTPVRVTRTAVAFETWASVESAKGVYHVQFSIPVDAPFSFDGQCLTLRWELVARGSRPRRVDAQTVRDLQVAP